MYSEDSFLSFVNKFAEYPVIMVKVICQIEELNKRERERGDRDIGLAANQFKYMESQTKYDFIVDTHVKSADECARLIIELLKNQEQQFTSFMALKINPKQWMNPSIL